MEEFFISISSHPIISIMLFLGIVIILEEIGDIIDKIKH